MESKRRKAKARRNDGYSVYQHRSGRWEWMVTIGYHENGTQKRARGYASTRDEAVAAAQAVAHKQRVGGFVPATKDTALSDYLDAWLALYVKPHKEPKTTAFYEANIRLHLKPALGKVSLRILTPQHIQKLINEKGSSGLSSSTVHGILRTLRTALMRAWKEGLIETNPAQKVSMPKLEHGEAEHLTPVQAASLLQASKGTAFGNLIAFALSTGVRIGEATGITWDNVDLEKGEVRIVQQLQRIDGKLTLKGLKSRSSRRALALSPIALQAMQEERSRQVLLRSDFGASLNPLNLAFLNSEGRAIDPKNVDKHLKKILAQAGLPSISFHKLRHTAATIMVAAGVDLHQVKEQLGHSQISLTANLYAHGLTEAQRKASDTLSRILQEGKLD